MTPDSARPFVDILPPVAEALGAGRPVVALESTIITHGMPYPQNSGMAANVERIVAEEGAVVGELLQSRPPGGENVLVAAVEIAGLELLDQISQGDPFVGVGGDQAGHGAAS